MPAVYVCAWSGERGSEVATRQALSIAAPRRRWWIAVCLHVLAAGLAVADTRLLELPAPVAIVAVLLVAAHLASATSVGGVATVGLSFVPPFLGAAFLSIALTTSLDCGVSCPSWSDFLGGATSLLGVAFMTTIVLGPVWGAWRRRR
jgi:predicted transporter